ncbi:MAG: NAD(P)/FAD-dependent oxidoreductase [Acidobacteriota bacterium]
MRKYTYLIVGGGMSADAAARGIREVDASGSIGLIGAEPDPPYSRPPLSKALWKGEPFESIWKGTEELGVELHLGERAVALDVAGRSVRTASGREYGYQKLLLATGGEPRRIASWGDEVIYFRTARDYRRLRSQADGARHFVVIGGGFIGSEIAAGLAMAGQRVTLVFPEHGIGARVFPAELCRHLGEVYRDHGIDVLAGEKIDHVERTVRGSLVRTASGRTLAADAVVAGLGIEPGVELAVAAGLEVDNGIVVDELLRTRVPTIYAAGDVASWLSPALGGRVRVEHEDNALTQGRAAGVSMAGSGEPYRHLPFFYSDLFDAGYEAVGELDASLEVVADWKEPLREGVVYYLREGRVRGVLLWNTWGQVDAARALIASPGPYRAGDLAGRITTD